MALGAALVTIIGCGDSARDATDGASDVTSISDTADAHDADLADEHADEHAEVDPVDSDDTDAGPEIDERCQVAPPETLTFETLEGFTDTEDFAFDDQGRVVLAEGSNLVRITRDGAKRLFVPNIGATAGMRFLPGGDLVVSDLDTGSLRRVRPNGGSTVFLSGLEYANGIEVDRDGFVYVAEQNAGRVRRVQPDTGEFEVVGYGMSNPNGLSLSVDERTLFVGSFGAGVVYAIDLAAPSARGATRLFGRIATVPEDSGALVDPCAGLGDGDACVTSLGGSGACRDIGDGLLDCVAPPPCEGLVAGWPCADPLVGEGRCEVLETGELGCTTACNQRGAGDACTTDDGGQGLCVDYGGGYLFCLDGACAGLAPDDPCVTTSAAPGRCSDVGVGLPVCTWFDPCAEGRAPGEACVMQDGTAATCQAAGGYCALAFDGCEAGTIEPGRKCQDHLGRTGQCQVDGGSGACAPRPGCEGLEADAWCVTDDGLDGRCRALGDALVCRAPDDCDARAEGAACHTRNGFPGTCVADPSGPTCRAPGCAELPVGASCDRPDGVGACSDASPSQCVAPDPCAGLPAGSWCYRPDGQYGMCRAAAADALACWIAADCGGQAEGTPCDLPGTQGGVCASGACADPYQPFFDACVGLASGDACALEYYDYPVFGDCLVYDDATPMFCQPTTDPARACTGLDEGAGCLVDGAGTGVCEAGEGGALSCSSGEGQGDSGGLDGITVDGCDNVYVTEYTLGQIWRFDPEGGVGAVVIGLPSIWIPNMHFGSGLGGWDRQRLYVTDRESGRLFELDTKTPASPDAWPVLP